MKILIVGAGAVGQVYGRHLQLGGADVTFFVKPKYEAAARSGFVLYPLNRRDVATPVRWTAFEVITTLEEVREGAFDQVWLCVSSPALRSGWFPEFAREIGEATVVSMLPGLEDTQFIRQIVPPDRVASGLINLISYQAPLPGETRFPEPGMAYWFPPLTGSPFSGAASTQIVAMLKRGGQPATTARDVGAIAGIPSALMMSNIAALECARWSFETVRSGDYLDAAYASASEAMRVAAHEGGTTIPLLLRVVGGPRTMRLVLRLAPWVIPMDLQTYLQVHFSKVGDQTALYLADYMRLGDKAGLPTAGLGALRDRLQQAREASGTGVEKV